MLESLCFKSDYFIKNKIYLFVSEESKKLFFYKCVENVYQNEQHKSMYNFHFHFENLEEEKSIFIEHLDWIESKYYFYPIDINNLGFIFAEKYRFNIVKANDIKRLLKYFYINENIKK